MLPYHPEGSIVSTPTPEAVASAMDTGKILQAYCYKCDESHNLYVDLGPIKGLIPREEAALGMKEGSAKEIAILSRVGKAVSFRVSSLNDNGYAVLSRREAQAEAKAYFLRTLRPGDVIPAVVQNPASFGAFCDIGCGVTALMRIDRCCISRLTQSSDIFCAGQAIYAAVLSVDHSSGQIFLTGRELLGSWEENADQFRPGQTVTGTVRSIMPYGIFVELTPNLSGLAEYAPGCREGDCVTVFLRAIQPDRHKIKLNILEKLPMGIQQLPLTYYISSGHIDRWQYYPGSNAVTYF